MRLIQVAVPVPALEALTYGVPPEHPDPVPGARVLVPLGNRVLTGCVIGLADHQQAAIASQQALKPIIDVLDEVPFLPPDIVRLAAWVAEYYVCGVGEAIAASMPPRAWIVSERHARITELGEARRLAARGARRDILDALTGGKIARIDGLVNRNARHATVLGLERDRLIEITKPLKGMAVAFRTLRVAALTAQGIGLVTTSDWNDASRLGPKQREVLDLLKGSPDGLETADLADRGFGPSTVKRLAELGLLAFTRRQVERDPFEHDAALPPGGRPVHTLTDEQASALDRLRALADRSSFQTALLHGVTGSGKTELYVRLAEHVRGRGRGVLLLVPEIALTPAVAAAFRAAFGQRVAIQHSGLSDGERHDQWQRIRRGDVDVVVGTRSAVFAPLGSVGLIIVDEEHDSSYKQEESPRYHGRDVAVVRGQHAGALVVLGSATPSMESYQNARSGRYALVALRRRVLDRPLAAVTIVDMRQEYAAAGPDVILSGALRDGLAERLERKEQSIVLLNRRGFATVVFCRECSATLECPNCSVSLTVHRAARKAKCHYCNYAIGVPKACANCKGPFLEQIGFGTERVEAEIREKLPAARVARVDRDTTRKRGSITAMLSRFAGGEIDVLVGTQMIAKGHDFPRVTLVGVISADVGLGMADFRAAERTFQLLTQVAGRAGRGEIAGEAIVQTIYPKHYSIRHACRQDYQAFFDEELTFRRAMRYPPAVALVNVVVKARTEQSALEDAGDLASALRSGHEPFRVLGPAPAPLNRLKGEHRAQLFIKGTRRASMRQAVVTALAARPELRRRTVVDIDPMSVL